MSSEHDRGGLDWLVELAGASAPAAAASFAAAKLAPVYGWPSGAAMLVGFGAVFVAAFALMRIVPTEAHNLVLPNFERPVMDDDVQQLIDALAQDELLLDTPFIELNELLLDTPFIELDELLLNQPMVKMAELTAVAGLLLDDPLPAAPRDSRVVQLFAGGRMPTAGQLQRRIDRHLANGEQPTAAIADASDALGEALAELRRTLRQA